MPTVSLPLLTGLRPLPLSLDVVEEPPELDEPEPESFDELLDDPHAASANIAATSTSASAVSATGERRPDPFVSFIDPP